MGSVNTLCADQFELSKLINNGEYQYCRYRPVSIITMETYYNVKNLLHPVELHIHFLYLKWKKYWTKRREMLIVFLIRKHKTITQVNFLFYDFFVHCQDPTRSDQFGNTSQEIHTWCMGSFTSDLWKVDTSRFILCTIMECKSWNGYLLSSFLCNCLDPSLSCVCSWKKTVSQVNQRERSRQPWLFVAQDFLGTPSFLAYSARLEEQASPTVFHLVSCMCLHAVQ